MKKYTGFEAIERLKTNVIDDGKSLYRYNMELNLIEFSMKEPELPWQNVIIDISFFFSREFVDYVEPLEVGDWVCHEEDALIGKVTKKEGRYVATDNMREGLASYWDDGLRKADPEEVALEKRRRVFKKHGRAIDEFKEGDIATPADNDKALLLIEDYNRQKNTVKIGGTYYTALDLNPLYFIENKVKIEN
ncbi:hypothetical protein COF41_21380 [Bacillus toyonensis]|uniref:hypothetical protein n=1 Tax=Bacillus toyonensis TaxID=155322 RepID=UPI000BFE5C32|nr:hypothetical protein [Bacillus toyonensis]PHE16406.1 hypothetical protein COF41_21380 [Bacillus toyonensis]